MHIVGFRDSEIGHNFPVHNFCEFAHLNNLFSSRSKLCGRHKWFVLFGQSRCIREWQSMPSMGDFVDYWVEWRAGWKNYWCAKFLSKCCNLWRIILANQETCLCYRCWLRWIWILYFALKFQLVRRDIFYNGQIQQDSTECLLMLINIIDKGSMPDSSSTTSPMGASLSDLLFSFVLEKYIVCEVCGLRSPSFESSSVLHISPTDTPSMQNLILEGLQQKLQKSCSRCNKNTRHIESSCILQPPKYLLLFVNRFRYLNNNIIKDRCPIPLDATVMLGPLKFNLQATIDHHGPSIDSGHYTASINCCKKHSIATITKLRSSELLIKTPLLHILYYINGLTHDFWTRTGGWEFDHSHGAGTSSLSHWQQVEEQAPKPVGWTMCFLLMTLVPVQKLCVDIYVYIYIYMCTFLIPVQL